MGSGIWTSATFSTYVKNAYKCSLDSTTGSISTNLSHQEIFKSRKLNEALNPKKVLRECCDSAEHPNTIPVILALDVTGSMGSAAVEVAKKLNVIMTKLYDKIQDVEFMVMGVGDLDCDDTPIQISQFESDIRIAEQLDKVYFEFGGGGNSFESYTSAWYMGSRHTKLDCWNRGRKGIIITMGDERMNPYLPKDNLESVTGDNLQANVETHVLFEEASKKFNIYHIDVDHGTRWDDGVDKSWELLGENYKKANLDSIADTICDIIDKEVASATNTFDVGNCKKNKKGEIVW